MPGPVEPLRGRRALVTGASGGIGRACALRLAEAGARVAVNGRRARALQELAAQIGGVAVSGALDDEGEVARLVDATTHALEAAPDILVNAAGAFRLAPIAETSALTFGVHIAVNLTAPFLLIRAVLPDMLRRRSGHIVSIGSIAGRQAFPHNGAYSASKFGLRGLHAVLDAELRGSGVRATLLEPAATDTPLWHSVDRSANPELPAADAMLRPEDVADAAIYAVTRSPHVDVRNLILERT